MKHADAIEVLSEEYKHVEKWYKETTERRQALRVENFPSVENFNRLTENYRGQEHAYQRVLLSLSSAKLRIVSENVMELTTSLNPSKPSLL